MTVKKPRLLIVEQQHYVTSDAVTVVDVSRWMVPVDSSFVEFWLLMLP